MEVGQWRPVELPYVTYGRNGPLLCEGRDLYGNWITSPSHFLRRHPASPHVFPSPPSLTCLCLSAARSPSIPRIPGWTVRCNVTCRVISLALKSHLRSPAYLSKESNADTHPL